MRQVVAPAMRCCSCTSYSTTGGKPDTLEHYRCRETQPLSSHTWSTPVECFVLSASKFWWTLIDHHLVSGKAITAMVTMNLIKVHKVVLHFNMAAAASLVKCCLCKSDLSPVNLRKTAWNNRSQVRNDE